MPALRDDDVCISLARLHELEVHRLDCAEVLIDHRLHRASPFRDIPLESPNEPRVIVGVDEHLDIHQPPQLGVRIDEDAFDDDGAAGREGLGHRLSRVASEVVDRHFDAAPFPQRDHVRHEQVRLERIGMIVIERRALLEPQIVAVAVVAIVGENGHLVVADAVDDPAHDGCLARCRTAGYADDERQRRLRCVGSGTHDSFRKDISRTTLECPHPAIQTRLRANCGRHVPGRYAFVTELRTLA